LTHAGGHCYQDNPQILDLPVEPEALRYFQIELYHRVHGNNEVSPSILAFSLIADQLSALLEKKDFDWTGFDVLEQKHETLKCVVRGMIPSSHNIYQDASDDYLEGARAKINWTLYGDCILDFFSKQDGFLETLQQVVQQSSCCYKNGFFNEKGEPELLEACLKTCDAHQNDTNFYKSCLQHLGQLAFGALTDFDQVPSALSQQSWKQTYQSYYIRKNNSFIGGEEHFM
jgi:hypothetical protein